MIQSFCGRHIGRDLMIPLYILSAQTRKLKNNTHTLYILYTRYTVTLPPSTRIEKQLTTYLLPICFQLRVSFFYSFFFSRTLLYAVPVSLIIIPPCRPHYGNRSTNLPFGNDEHTLYKTIFSEQCLQYTKKSSRKRLHLSPLGKRTDAEFASALHVEPFNTATKLYTHTRSTKKHTKCHSPCDRMKAPCTPSMRVVWCLPQRSSTKKTEHLLAAYQPILRWVAS